MASLEHKAWHTIKVENNISNILSLCTGRHPRLWYTAQSNELKKPLAEQAKLPPRTLNTLQADYLRFQTAGKGDIRQAKHHNNVISPVFLNIPISQV